MTIKCPRIVIAGLKGGSGKTIAALGIVHALAGQGLDIVPFKKGPDYIDAEWLSKSAGRPCYNLDPFLMDKHIILSSFAARSSQAELAVVEGNRGIFDGVDEQGRTSTARLATWLKAPVILVVDCTKATRTIAALVLGCKAFDPNLDIGGVILNRIGTKRQESVVRNAIERYTGIPVLGVIKRLKKDPLPMRHLGVTPTDEHPDLLNALDSLKRLIEQDVDLDSIKRLASTAPFLNFSAVRQNGENLVSQEETISGRPSIGVLRDAAFQFYYPENLEALESNGAKLFFINSLTDEHLPRIDALYIGGGFPETQAAKLTANTKLRLSIREAVESGMPVYAECGGLMFLGRNIIWKDKKFPMVGAIDWDFVVEKKPAGHGYTNLEVIEPNPFYPKGTLLRGHEFHYSRPVPCSGKPRGKFSCKVTRGAGFCDNLEGLCYKGLFATYTHIHALSCPKWAKALVAAATKFGKQRHKKS